MNKFIKILLTFVVVLTLTSIAKQANADENNNYDSDIERIYQQGKDKGILTDDNMPFEQFSNLMKDSVIPAYESNKEDDSFNQSLDDFTSDDNYEVDNTTPTLDMAEANAQEMPKFGHNKVKASKSYNMKAGDIMVCYGSNPMGTLIGHAAIAYDSQNILEMPGPPTPGAKITSKKNFFSKYARNAKEGKYVNIYRVSNSNYAKNAANYAYNNMYKGSTNPSYWLNPWFNDKMHSYCSKYVFLAYYNSNKSSVSQPMIANNFNSYIRPHELQNYFSSQKKLTNITSY